MEQFLSAILDISSGWHSIINRLDQTKDKKEGFETLDKEYMDCLPVHWDHSEENIFVNCENRPSWIYR